VILRKPDLSKLSFSGVPTMIVPPGTQIQVDAQGQVSIRTPGNLVLQNSGVYATLESVSGSVRIEPNVHIEAVTVRCADTCFVQGTLTAWRVTARTLHVDADAEAHVVMQETEHLEVGRNGRVVGNFRSEKELFHLFSRYSGHLRALPLPGGQDAGDAKGAEGHVDDATIDGELADGEPAAEPPVEPPAARREPTAEQEPGETAAAARSELPDELCLALLLLEQESTSEGPAGRRRSREQLLRLLREGDLDTLRHTYKTLFARLGGDGDGVLRARRLVGSFFDAEAAAARAAGAARTGG
jgi:hypothetical protein